MARSEHPLRPERPGREPAVRGTPSNACDDPLGRLGLKLGGRYHLTEYLGAGGAGDVYRATNSQSDGKIPNNVAIKIIRDQDSVAALRQLTGHGHIRSPHVVEFFGWGQHEERTFIVMELLEGTTLDKLGAQPPDKVVQIIHELAQGIDDTHKQGYVHQDLKPSNVVLHRQNGEDVVKIIDLGSARPPTGDDHRTENVVISKGWTPEPQRQGIVKATNDIEAMGRIAFYLLMGHRVDEHTQATIDKPWGIRFSEWLRETRARDDGHRGAFKDAQSAANALREALCAGLPGGEAHRGDATKTYPAPRRDPQDRSLASIERPSAPPTESAMPQPASPHHGAPFAARQGPSLITVILPVVLASLVGALVVLQFQDKRVRAGGQAEVPTEAAPGSTEPAFDSPPADKFPAEQPQHVPLPPTPADVPAATSKRPVARLKRNNEVQDPPAADPVKTSLQQASAEVTPPRAEVDREPPAEPPVRPPAEPTFATVTAGSRQEPPASASAKQTAPEVEVEKNPYPKPKP